MSFEYSLSMAILANSRGSVRAISGSGAATPWQQEMKRAIRSTEDLARELDLDFRHFGPIRAAEKFPVFVPRPFLARIHPGDPDDPLLRQVLAVPAEDSLVPGYSPDPLAELDSNPVAGMLHKYSGRALLITTGACAIHCRYCFRRHFPYQESPQQLANWEPAFERIEADPSLAEIILSGGDPLTWVDERISQLIQRLDFIPHVRRIRVHTRLPIVIPSRVTEPLLKALGSSSKQIIFVLHANHANEIDSDVATAIQRLRNVCSQLLNQSVLLRGVNDSADALVGLSERLLSCDVLPYYLHQLDPVTGAAHFAVDIERGKQLLAAMRARLPGYAVPRYVRELAGEPGKTVLV